MVAGVVPDVRICLSATANNNAPLSAVIQSRGFHRVLTVVIGILFGQPILVIAEVLAIGFSVIGFGAGEDIFDLLVSFLWKRGDATFTHTAGGTRGVGGFSKFS